MVKRSTIFTIHFMAVFLRNIFIFFILLGILLFLWLKNGIQIDTFKIAHYGIDELYIKLDKKLNLKVKKLTLPRRKANPSFENIDETLNNVKYTLTFFDEIEIKEIDFENNILAIHFKDDMLEVSSKDYLIRGNVKREGNLLVADVPTLILKKYDLSVKGSFSYDIKKDLLLTQGRYQVDEIEGDFNVSKKENEIDFSLEADPFSSLDALVSKLTLSPTVKKWLLKGIQVKTYQLKHLTGKANIRDKTLVLDTSSVKLWMSLLDVSINFKKGLAPIMVPKAVMTYSKKGLLFDLEKPRYMGKNLSGSKAAIANVMGGNSILYLNVNLHTVVDKNVQDLLKAYGIALPVLQKKGKVKGYVNMEIGLESDYKKFVTDLDIEKGDMWIKGVKLPIQSGHIHHEKEKIELSKIVLKNAVYSGRLDASIDLKNSKLKGLFQAHYIKLGSKTETIFDLKKETLPFSFDYKKVLEVKVPKLGFVFQKENNVSTLTFSDFHKIKKYIQKELPLSDGGHMQVRTHDFKSYTYKGLLNFYDCFLYESSNACRSKIDFEGTVHKEKIDFYAFKKHVHYKSSTSEIRLSKIGFDLKKFFEMQQRNKVQNKTKSKKGRNSKALHILGKNSHLRYGKHKLLTDSYDVHVNTKGEIQAIGNAGGDIVQFSKVGHIITLETLEIKDEILHPLIDFDGLHHGRYSMHLKGEPGTFIKGHILVKGGVMRDFKAYNNTLAFINTIPALATLHKPGYSDKGFVIQTGNIDFRILQGHKVILDKIDIKGDTSHILGAGVFDIKSRSLNVELRIQVAQSLGNVVGNIPLLGYILVGEDKRVTIGLKITGTLDKPKVSVSTPTDILKYPIDVITRTLKTPQRLLKSLPKKKKVIQPEVQKQKVPQKPLKSQKGHDAPDLF